MKAAVDKEPVSDEWFGLVPGQDPSGSAAERRSRTDNLTTAFSRAGHRLVKPSRPGSRRCRLPSPCPVRCSRMC
jgi:hypothetical protein